MKVQVEQGMTLIEMLIAIAVMTVVLAAAFASVKEAVKLHKELHAQSTWMVDRCALAEQLTSDFRSNRSAQPLEAGKWSLTRADGIETIYEQQNDSIVRVLASDPKVRKVFSVGKVDTTFPASEPGRLMRLKFSDTELILTR